MTDFNFSDVHAFAVQQGLSADGIREIEKLAARTGLSDDDLALIPADLDYFEAKLAPTSYASVSRSRDQEKSRKRANSRIRSILKAFWRAQEGTPGTETDADHREAWTVLIDWIAAREGLPSQGAAFTKGFSTSLTTLRARAACAPADLSQAEVDRLGREVNATARKAVNRAIGRLNTLRRRQNGFPELRGMLPAEDLTPLPPRRQRLDASSLPEGLVAAMAAVIARATETPEDQAAVCRARLAAGEDRAAVMADFERQATREIGNRGCARAGYRDAMIWVFRNATAAGIPASRLADVSALFDDAVLDAAIAQHLAHVRADPRLKAPERSQTLHNRLTNLLTIARHGLRDQARADAIVLMRQQHAASYRRPGQDGIVEEIRTFCQSLSATPSIAAGLVNAPDTIGAVAEQRLAEARTPRQELSALRLHAGAVMVAFQSARPTRPENLQRMRLRAAETALHRLVFLDDGARARVEHPANQVKNAVRVPVEVVGGDAALVRRWVRELRPRYMQRLGIEQSDYVFPGRATPRNQKDGVSLPRGCIAHSTLNEIWSDAVAVVGLSLTPHMMRHAVATLVLAVKPGDHALVAAILADTEETVRRHYGHEDGARAAAETRQLLLARHPDLFSSLKRRLA